MREESAQIFEFFYIILNRNESNKIEIGDLKT